MAKLERDPNAESVWAENNGGLFQIEIDALNALRPEDFVSLLEDTVDSHFDMDIYTDIMEDPKYSPGAIRKLHTKPSRSFPSMKATMRQASNIVTEHSVENTLDFSTNTYVPYVDLSTCPRTDRQH